MNNSEILECPWLGVTKFRGSLGAGQQSHTHTHTRTVYTNTHKHYTHIRIHKNTIRWERVRKMWRKELGKSLVTEFLHPVSKNHSHDSFSLSKYIHKLKTTQTKLLDAWYVYNRPLPRILPHLITIQIHPLHTYSTVPNRHVSLMDLLLYNNFPSKRRHLSISYS